MNIWIRGVSFENRAQSMAWSSIFVRVIGGIPGPILVGYMLDTTRQIGLIYKKCLIHVF